MELVSCVKAVLRRCQPQTRRSYLLQSGGLISLNPDEHTVTANGARVELTYKEFELLRLFLSASRHGLHPRPAASEKVWGTDYCGETRTVDMHIRTLRQKLGACGEHNRHRARRRLPIGGFEMTKKIFRSIVLVAVCALLASLLLIMGCLYDYFTGLQSQALRDELTFAASGVSQSGEGYLDTLSSSQYRLTWIAADGTVLYDTQADAASMENHASREEVQQALATGEGESSRYSQTLLEKTIYVAKRLPDGTVLRISVLRQTLAVLLLGMLQPVLVVALAAVILSALLARRLARRIVEPLNAIDLDHPLDANAYDEVAPLLRRIERQHRQIDDQLLELQRKTDEFTHITQSMPEGLVLLDNEGAVLSINPAARKLFGAEDSCVGQDFLTLDRSLDVTQAIARAKDAGHSETRAELSGRIYQFDISRIDSGGETIGAVLLCL